MGFWIIAVALCLAVAALFVLAMLRGRRDARTASSGASDIQVYRDQLTEVDRDLARGVLNEAEAEQVRLEISRRLLDADRKANADAGADTGNTPQTATLVGGGVVAVAVLAGTLLLYRDLGAPGFPDLPLAARIEMADTARANRPDQVTAEAEMAGRIPPVTNADPRRVELVEQLRQAMVERPDDLTGQTLLARHEAALGNYAAARVAQERVIALLGDRAVAADYADLADMMVLAAGGFVSPEAEAALLETLRRDATNGTALYYSGLLYLQTGRPDLAFTIWRPLMERSDPNAPWYLPIRAQIEDLAQLAGVRYTPPPPPAAPRGPSADDMAAAQDMDPEDRMAMIEGMVANLSDRLATQGGSAEEWAQLITALGVLGRQDEARAIADEAMSAFAAAPSSLPLIEDARRRAGIAE